MTRAVKIQTGVGIVAAITALAAIAANMVLTRASIENIARARQAEENTYTMRNEIIRISNSAQEQTDTVRHITLSHVVIAEPIAVSVSGEETY